MDALTIYFLVMSVLLFILMGVDKLKAKLNHRRIPETTLFMFAILGGAVGGTMGMLSFRHKTRHWYFAVFFPLLALVDLSVLLIPKILS